VVLPLLVGWFYLTGENPVIVRDGETNHLDGTVLTLSADFGIHCIRSLFGNMVLRWSVSCLLLMTISRVST
jgi:hypothetical protein